MELMGSATCSWRKHGAVQVINVKVAAATDRAGNLQNSKLSVCF